jgi:cell volume regulation protein A
MDVFLLAAAALVFGSILLTPISSRVGAPLLLLFLLIGMLVGEDGPGRYAFDDFSLAYNIGSVALAIILFSGGLDTSKEAIRKAAGPALALATVGVVLTSAIVGGIAAWLFDQPATQGLLLGAVVGSTDAAATFLLLQQRGVRLKGRVGETILVESAVNDPMAIFLTTALVTLVDSGAELSWAALPSLLPILGLQLGLGALAGLAGGRALAWLIDRVHLSPGLNPPFALAGAVTLFAGTQYLGGSGFLAIYLCGVLITATTRRDTRRIQTFHEGLAWLSQIVMFLMLGLLVTPSDLGATLVPGLTIAAILMFAARPLAVVACLLPFGFNPREHIYVGWVGLRGAVPIFLAIIPVISPGPVTVSFFNMVFVIVICSLVLQGWTIPVVARWLGLAAGESER